MRAGHIWRLPLALLLLFPLRPHCSRAQGPLPIQRFGADLTREFGEITDYDVSSLHIAWYSDWGVRADPPRPGSIDYVAVIRTPQGVISPPLAQLAPVIEANRGLVWLVGNEPDARLQDNCTPEQYAAAYHEAYAFIKAHDATAQVAIAGVVQPTPLRLKWLDRVLDHYQATYGEAMPVDVWNIHNLILQELKGSWGCQIPPGLDDTSGRLYTIADNDNIAIFRQHVVEFRTWMRDRGQRNKPLIITEYGVLMPVQYGFTPERVNAYMSASFDYLLTARDDDLGCPDDGNRLVQRWLWCSLNDQPYDPSTGRGFNGALFDYRTREITAMGANFRGYTDALAAGRVCLSGRVGLAGRPARPHTSYVLALTVNLYPPGGGSEVRHTQTDATGHFGLCNLAAGSYDVVVKGLNTLSKRLSGVQVSAEAPVVDLGLLVPGDADGNDCVEITDYSILAYSYGKARGQPGYDVRADFDGDGANGIVDYSLLASHYAACGQP